MTPAALLWDIDGTLLTTARAGIGALEDAAAEVCGSRPELDAMPTAGLTDAQVAERVLERCGVEPAPERVRALLDAYERHLPERLGDRRGRVMPGVVAVLEALRTRPDVVSLLLTGNTAAGARAKLTHYGLDGYFPDGGAFCTGPGDRVEIARRARELVAERLGAPPDPERMFVVGDTPHDVRCGRAIGARTVAVASPAHPPGELEACGAWLVLDRLPPARRFLEALGL